MTTPSSVATPAKTPISEEGYEKLKEGARKGGIADRDISADDVVVGGCLCGGPQSQQVQTAGASEERTGTGIDRIPTEKLHEGGEKGGEAGGRVQHERAEAVKKGESL